MTKKATSIRWFPPSWLLIQRAGKVIYIDPAWIQKNFETYPGKVIFSHYPDPMDGLPEANLPKADYIFYTHHHQDHIKTTTLKRLATNKTVIYAPAKCAKFIPSSFIQVKAGQTFKLGDILIKIVQAYNTPEGHSTRKQHQPGQGVGYLLTIAGQKTIYHAGDTDIIPEMRDFGSVQVAFLPIGGKFTMDVDEAARAAHLLKADIAIPMHYLGVKPQLFEKAMLDKGKVRILKIGETLIL